MKDNQLPFSLTPAFMVVTSLIYTVVILMLAIFLLVPNASASSKGGFSSISNAKYCADAARLAANQNYVQGKAIVHCNLAIRTEYLNDKDLAITYNNRGVLYKKLDRYSNALRDYYSARNINKDFAGIYINIGNVHFANQDLQLALKYYDKALSYYGQQLNNLQDHDKRIKRATVVDLTAAFTNRGLVNEKLGLLHHAIRDYRSAIASNPKAILALSRLEFLQLGSDGLDASDSNQHFVLQGIVGL